MFELKPEVNETAELLEISTDFGDPREIVREGISNSFDAKAKKIEISAYIDETTGIKELVVLIKDDGEGMGKEEIKFFFGLGFTNRIKKDELGKKVPGAIGEKGHGTKIYYNSRRIEVETIKDNHLLRAFMNEPKSTLRRAEMPVVNYEVEDTVLPPGTKIIVRGYNNNDQSRFSHGELKDYIYWFTKFGSFEKEITESGFDNISILLKGLDWKENEPESLKFGHKFPEENTDIRKLTGKDKVSPLDYYVARWVFPGEPVIGKPATSIDMVFYLEGDMAKRKYNTMIHEKWQRWLPGEYTVQQRYGLWLCKDYIPVERRNQWVAERTEWTKYHAFVNCQEFSLTANRRDLGNTSPDLLDAVENTVREIFKRIEQSNKFKKYKDELVREVQEKTAGQEETDFNRRVKLALEKRVAEYDNLEFFEPRQESGVFMLVLQLLTKKPDLFGFKLIDYDTSFGYDLLVTKDYSLDLAQTSKMFVEIKYELKRDFNHSFRKLAAVICWDTKLYNDAEVIDIRGERRSVKITPPSSDPKLDYKKYMLVSQTEPHNIEVFVLREFLESKIDLKFSSRTENL
jgi:hypothetical protein